MTYSDQDIRNNEREAGRCPLPRIVGFPRNADPRRAVIGASYDARWDGAPEVGDLPMSADANPLTRQGFAVIVPESLLVTAQVAEDTCCKHHVFCCDACFDMGPAS